MTRILCRLLPPLTPHYLAGLRRWARAWMVSRHVDVDGDDVVLAMTELVGNSVRHGSGPIEVDLCDDGDLLVLQVTDGSDALPGQPHQRATSEGGRGLLLIENLAVRWGVRPRQGGGKTVWCEFAPRAGGTALPSRS